MQLFKTLIGSPVGVIEICGSESGIRSVLYREEGVIDSEIPECLVLCASQLKEYFNGTRKQFEIVLDPVGTDFQLLVWKKLLTIPYGQTISYLQLAQLTGNKANTRAVGNANGKNKLNILVPCHRVIGISGKLTGYGGGLWRKEWLLKHEKAFTPEGLFVV